MLDAWQWLSFLDANPQDLTWHDTSVIHPSFFPGQFALFASTSCCYSIEASVDTALLASQSFFLRPKSTGGCWAPGIWRCQTRPRKVNPCQAILQEWKMHYWTWDEDGIGQLVTSVLLYFSFILCITLLDGSLEICWRLFLGMGWGWGWQRQIEATVWQLSEMDTRNPKRNNRYDNTIWFIWCKYIYINTWSLLIYCNCTFNFFAFCTWHFRP